MCSLFVEYGLLENLIEDRRDVAAKLFGVLAHRKMTELLHDGDAGALDRCSRPQRIVRRAGEIVLAGQQIERTGAGVDPLNAAAQVAIDPVEVKIALEHARSALHVAPQGFA